LTKLSITDVVSNLNDGVKEIPIFKVFRRQELEVKLLSELNSLGATGLDYAASN
jgi:hypothetical protein